MSQERDSRVARSKDAVIAATVELLATAGIAEVSVDDIAARSGVAKTTIYRHWETKTAVLLDAMRSLVSAPDDPDTGSAESDVRLVLEQFADRLAEEPRSSLLAGLLDAAQRDRGFDATRERYVAGWREALTVALCRGVARGELDDQCHLEGTAEALLAPLLFRRLVSRQAPTRAEAARATTRGLAPHLPRVAHPGVPAKRVPRHLL